MSRVPQPVGGRTRIQTQGSMALESKFLTTTSHSDVSLNKHREPLLPLTFIAGGLPTCPAKGT